MKDINTICVFCSSSDDIDKKYFETAYKFGRLLSEHGKNLVHGAGKIGLMGELERGARNNSAKVTGIIPERLHKTGIFSETLDKLIVTKDMAERKTLMNKYSDAFVVLAGGFGTLEEVLEVITLKQLKYHQKPIVFINTDGFYNALLEQFEIFYNEKFTNKGFKDLYYICNTADEACEYLKNYKYEEFVDKWL